MGNLFDLSCYTSSRSFQAVMLCNNTVTNNLFGLSILLMVFSIAIITMLYAGVKQALAASLWLTTLVSMLLWVLQLISPDIMVTMTVITALSSVFLFRTREN